jgi:copper chaperone
MEELILNVAGMSCNHCKMAVEKSLQKLAGVKSADVDLAGKTVKIAYEKGQATLADFEQAVAEAGIEVVKK